MTPLQDHALLSLWEHALPLPWPAREALFAGFDNAAPAHTLGAQRLRVLALHRRVSGAALPLRCQCPACGEGLGFEVDLDALAAALPEPPAGAQTLALEGREWRFRLPAPDDVAAADTPDVEAFVQRLAARCVLDEEAPLPASVVAALAERIETLDPAAALSFTVACPACAHAWDAAFDPARTLWAFVQTHAEQTLLDVDVLARRYGWTEAEVLALSPTRRRAYLQLADGG